MPSKKFIDLTPIVSQSLADIYAVSNAAGAPPSNQETREQQRNWFQENFTKLTVTDTTPVFKGISTFVPVPAIDACFMRWISEAFDSDSVVRQPACIDFCASDTSPGLAYKGGLNLFVETNGTFFGATKINAKDSTIYDFYRCENLIGYQSFSEQVVVALSQDVDSTIIGRTVLNADASPVVLTIPFGAGLPLNSEFEVVRVEAGPLSVAGAVGVELNGSDGATVVIPDQYNRGVFRHIIENKWTWTLYSSTLGSITNQEVYNVSPAGTVATAAGKTAGWTGTEASFITPSMTSAQFSAIVMNPSGGQGWGSDLNRPVYNIGTPGAPILGVGAMQADIDAISEDVVYASTYLSAQAETVINTAGTFVQIAGTFSPGKSADFVSDANGTITSNLDATRDVEIVASVTVALSAITVGRVIVAAFYYDGIIEVEVEETRQIISFDGVSPSFKNVVVSGLATMKLNDTMKIKMTNENSPAKNISSSTVNFRVNSIGGSSAGGSEQTWQQVYDFSPSGALIVADGKPLVSESTDNAIIPEWVTNQNQIPAALQVVGQFRSLSKNSLNQVIEYGNLEFTAETVTAGAEDSLIRLWGYKGGVKTLVLQYRGDVDSILLNRNVSLNNTSLTGINSFIQNAQDATFNDSQGNGSFIVKTPSDANAFKIDYNGNLINCRVPLTMLPAQAGVNFTLGSVVTPRTEYTPGVYQTVWAGGFGLDGTNIVSQNQFQIGQTIEMDIVGVVSVLVPGPNNDQGSSFLVSFGTAFSIASDSIPLGNASTRKRNWSLKIKITRINLLQIRVSASGSYYNNSQDNKHIAFTGLMDNPVRAYSELLSYDFTLQYLNNNSSSTALVFIASNLNIKQYS